MVTSYPGLHETATASLPLHVELRDLRAEGEVDSTYRLTLAHPFFPRAAQVGSLEVGDHGGRAHDAQADLASHVQLHLRRLSEAVDPRFVLELLPVISRRHFESGPSSEICLARALIMCWN